MNKVRAIALGGLIGGLLDIIYAFIVYGPLTYHATPERVLQSVAAGWIGRDASVAGGLATAGLGLATHFGIALIMASVFVVAAGAAPALLKRPIISGLIYGFGLYIMMNYVVVPLSAASPEHHFATGLDDAATRLATAFSEVRPKEPGLLAGTLFTHMALVGLPIALVAKRFAKG